MTDIIEELTGGGTAPPWLSGPLREAREMAYYAKLVSAIFATFMLFYSLWNFRWIWMWGIGFDTFLTTIYSILGAFLMGLTFAIIIQRKIINAIDQRKVAEAKNDMGLWILIGLLFGILPGILLIICKNNMEEASGAFQQAPPGQAPPAQYNYQQPSAESQQQYQAPPQPVGATQTQQPSQQYDQPQPQPQQYQAPPQPVGVTQPQPSQPMGMDGTVICPNCGAQIPPYMHTCPKCGAPRPGTQL